MSSTKKNRLIFTLVIALLTTIFMSIGVQFVSAKAENTIKTVSEVTFEMENGASIYNNYTSNKMGIRFGASMTETDYNALINNVGPDKTYNSVKVGIIIAPATYESKHGEFNAKNLFGIGGESVYDWASWDANNGWVYDNVGKIRVVNIQNSFISQNNGKTTVIGAITTILPENLLTEFKGVGYIIAEKNNGGYDYAFASENDNVRSPAYVAQLRQLAIKDEIASLDAVADVDRINVLNNESTTLENSYLTDVVKETDATYTVEHYYLKPDASGYFLYETTTQTGKINSELSAFIESGSDIANVTFDTDNENNYSSPIIFAQNKSVVKVYYDVIYSADSNDTETIFDISSSEDYTAESGVLKLYSTDMTEIDIVENKISNQRIVEIGKGEHDLYALTENGFEKYSVILATHVISTADEFVTFFNSYSGSANNNGTSDWYAVVVDNINLSNTTKTFIGKGTSDYYNGVFNGLGHVIDNLVVAGNQGLFGYTSSSVEIKNFALTNMVAGAKAVLSNYLSGKASNIYVQGTANSDASLNRPVLNLFTHTSSASNIVVNIAGSFTYAFKKDSGQYGEINNCYAIGAKNLCDKTEKVTDCAIYDGIDEFYTQEKNNINEDNGFNKYWKNTTFGIYFGNTLVAANKEPTEVKTTKYFNVVEVGYSSAVNESKTHEIDLKAILGCSPEKVYVDGIEVEATDKITLNSANYEYGSEHSILFGANNVLIKQPFMFATHVITNEEEFVTFIDSYSGGNFDSAISNGTQTWYAVLTNDLVMTDKSFTKNKSTSDYYSGTFDGLGHCIDNVPITSDMGIFGYVSRGAVLKNFALTNVNAANKYILSGLISGTIENIYMHGEYTMSNNTRGPLLLDANNATIKNSVLAIKTKTPAICLSDCSTAANRIQSTCYVTSIRAFAGICGWTTSINGYCNEEYKPSGAQMHKAADTWNPSNATLLLSNATFIEDISAGVINGWSKYWNLTGDAASGYTLKFGSFTIGSTVIA